MRRLLVVGAPILLIVAASAVWSNWSAPNKRDENSQPKGKGPLSVDAYWLAFDDRLQARELPVLIEELEHGWYQLTEDQFRNRGDLPPGTPALIGEYFATMDSFIAAANGRLEKLAKEKLEALVQLAHVNAPEPRTPKEFLMRGHYCPVQLTQQ